MPHLNIHGLQLWHEQQDLLHNLYIQQPTALQACERSSEKPLFHHIQHDRSYLPQHSHHLHDEWSNSELYLLLTGWCKQPDPKLYESSTDKNDQIRCKCEEYLQQQNL